MAQTPGSAAALAGTLALWIGRVLLAAAFLAAAWMKLSGAPMMVTEFGVIGFGQWFRIFTGAVEIAGAGLLLFPVTTFYGALLLLCVDAGALAAQLGPLHGDIVHVLVLGALLALIAWATRPKEAA